MVGYSRSVRSTDMWRQKKGYAAADEWRACSRHRMKSLKKAMVARKWALPAKQHAALCTTQGTRHVEHHRVASSSTVYRRGGSSLPNSIHAGASKPGVPCHRRGERQSDPLRAG